MDLRCDLIFVHLRIAFPPLRKVDNTAFSLHLPRSDISSDSDRLDVLLESAVDLDVRVEPSSSVELHFSPPVAFNQSGKVNAIICLSEQGTFQFYSS
jgi:hypothetical protein